MILEVKGQGHSRPKHVIAKAHPRWSIKVHLLVFTCIFMLKTIKRRTLFYCTTVSALSALTLLIEQHEGYLACQPPAACAP